jgi:hypothetical protein
MRLSLFLCSAILMSIVCFSTVKLIDVYAQNDFTPTTFSPAEHDVPSDGMCVKGRAECRWGGDCSKVGGKCYSCIENQHYRQGLGCYTCPQGYSLLNRNGHWVCSK